MKFYNRINEIKILQEMKNISKISSKMTFIIGRRRVGKTRLIKEAFKNNLLYFFVSKKNEHILCEEYSSLIENFFGKRIIGKLNSFKEIFLYLMEEAKIKNYTLAIDEFQEFYNINPSIFSDIQNIWDEYKNKTKLNFIISGSIYSMMYKIFENAKEPLYGRADKKIILKPFNINDLKDIYIDLNKKFSKKDFFAFYILTGGMPKYIEIFNNEKAFTLNKMIDVIFSEGSFFINEGKDVLIEEFGKEYQTYFSILTLIADSKNSRTEMESILEKSIGGFLDKLERDFRIIEKIKPILSKPNTRSVKYRIKDNFLNFWFRFIYKNMSTIEMGNFEYVKKIVKRDYSTYTGKMLEKYFLEKLSLTGKFNKIGSYWERGNKNEIDIIAINEMEKYALIAEVKINKNKIDLNRLKQKSEKLIKKLDNFRVEYKGFSIEDI